MLRRLLCEKMKMSKKESFKYCAEEHIGFFKFKLVQGLPDLPPKAEVYHNKEHIIDAKECLPISPEDQFSLIMGTVLGEYLYYTKDGTWWVMKGDPDTPEDDDSKMFIPLYIEVSMREGGAMPKEPSKFMGTCKMFYFAIHGAYLAGMKAGVLEGVKVGLEQAKEVLKKSAKKVIEETHEPERTSLNPKFH